MANNGGTLNGVPQQTQRVVNNSCNTCSLTFDSSDSFQVHVHYHHTSDSGSINRWGQVTNSGVNQTNNSGNSPQTINGSSSLQPTTSDSPTDSENNNQLKSHNISQKKTNASPVNFTVSAAADSSDNQPPTPQSTASGENSQTLSHQGHQLGSRHSQGFSAIGTNSFNQSHHYPQQQHVEMHYPSYMTSYDQYYHQHSIEYGLPPPNHYLNNALPPSQSQHSTVPSSNRFHPYGPIANTLSSHHAYASHHISTQAQSQSVSAMAAAAAVSAAQGTMSPSVVTSSSPIQNNLMHSTTVPSAMTNAQQSSAISSQPTPSPSPRQCDKCGFVCETITQLNEHQASAHTSTDSTINRGANNDIESDIPAFQYSNYGHTKEEQSTAECDILDLDSQKMVYPPHDVNQQGPLPPMHSLHPIQRPMMWPHAPPLHDPNNFLPIPASGHVNDLKSPMFGAIKSEFSPQIVKQEAPSHLTQLPNTQSSQPQTELQKSFGSDGNQLTTSPSEFPSTTTPQDNGSQFRTFEPATSSLPNGAPIIKATSWKSNEARRPKTYNCTACNKWFTSSGHLKRHYNTTLHKNAVKSSGLPDPAGLPISAHHHPARAAAHKNNPRQNNNNSTHNNNLLNNAQNVQMQQPPQQISSESSRTPDYTSNQYSSSGLNFSSQNHPSNAISFQQYNVQNQIQSTPSIHPNAQAGLSGLSQPRDLLIYSNIHSGAHSNHHMQTFHQRQSLVPDFIQAPLMPQILPESTMHSISSMEQHCNITTPITINTSITQLYPLIQRPEDQSYTIIGSNSSEILSNNVSSPPINEDTANIETPSMVPYYGAALVVTSTASSSSQNDPNYNAIKQEYYEENYGDYNQQMSGEEKATKNDYAPNAIPAIVALRKLNSDIYLADTVPPFSPDVPDKRISAPYIRSHTPKTGEIVPTHLSPNAPQSYADIPASSASICSEPSSPSITSTNTAIGAEQKITKVTGSKMKSKANTKRRSCIDSSKLITNTIPAGNDPLRCVPCDKVFNKACYLTQHNKTFHSGEKPFKCQRCGKRFPCDQSHDEHLAKHMGNKPFKCDFEECPKQFNHKTDLRRHMCLHTGNKPYTCKICNKGFIRKDHMVKHGLTHFKRKNGEMASNPTSTASALPSSPQPEAEELGKQKFFNSNNKASKRNTNVNSKKKKKFNDIAAIKNILFD